MTIKLEGTRRSATFPWFPVLLFVVLPAVCCTVGSPLDPVAEAESLILAADAISPEMERAGGGPAPKATGLVEIVWPGGKGKTFPPGEEKLAFAEFEAHPPTARNPARGSFTYRVLNPDLTTHREIVAEVYAAVVKPELGKAWFAAEVVSDTKYCGGVACQDHGDGGCGGDHTDGGGCSGGGDHTDGGGCSGGDDHTDGGCSGGDDHTDGGCSGGGDHPDGEGGMGGDSPMGGTGGTGSGGPTDGGGCTDGGDHTDGGCTDGGDHTDGGCSGGGDHTDGGCSGGGDHPDGGCSGGGQGGHGGVPGKDPRVGQIVAVKVHDRTTPGDGGDGPGPEGDGITWKWFYPDDPNVPVIGEEELKHLCKKTIIGGNLVVHPVSTSGGE